MTVTKLTDVFDVRDWTSGFGDGTNDDGATITAVAAYLRTQRAGGVVAVPVPAFLDSPAVIPPGVYLKGNGRSRSKLTVRGAPFGVHHLGEDLGDFLEGGGSSGISIELTDAGQGGMFLEGTREVSVRDVIVLGSNVGGAYGFKLAPRTTGNNGGSAFNYLYNLTATGIDAGPGLWLTSVSAIQEAGVSFCNRQFARFSRSQSCQIGVLLEDSDTNHFDWWDTQGCTDAGYRLQGNANGAGSSFNYISTVLENPAALLDIDVASGSSRNRFRGVWGISRVNDAGANNQFEERFLNHFAETHLDQEFSRELIVDTPWANAGATRALSMSNGNVAELTLNANTVFSVTGQTEMATIDGLQYANPVFEFRLILRNAAGNTPDFSGFVTEWAAPGGVQPAWPANTTVTNFYSSDGGASWLASPVSGF